MLNYILPPIIIIVSVSTLIMFLFRKAAQIPAADLITEQEKNDSEKTRAKIMSVLGNFSLKFLERMMHRSKLLSLKFHNVSNEWFQMIREKRQRAARLQKDADERRMHEEVKAPEIIQQQREDISEIRRTPRPMVASRVTLPMRMKEKNQLEDVLIKRIAINPKDIEAYERLGDYYLESENFQDSLECFKQVLKLSPTHQKARMSIRRLERMR
jgi:tetratricopeptide (TPR) repeat protein